MGSLLPFSLRKGLVLCTFQRPELQGQRVSRARTPTPGPWASFFGSLPRQRSSTPWGHRAQGWQLVASLWVHPEGPVELGFGLRGLTRTTVPTTLLSTAPSPHVACHRTWAGLATPAVTWPLEVKGLAMPFVATAARVVLGT